MAGYPFRQRRRLQIWLHRDKARLVARLDTYYCRDTRCAALQYRRCDVDRKGQRYAARRSSVQANEYWIPFGTTPTGRLLLNGTKPEGTSVVLDRVDPNNGETVSTIDTGQQSFPFGMYSSEDHSIFLQNNNGLSSEPNKQSIVDVAQDGGTSVVSASGPDLVSIG